MIATLRVWVTGPVWGWAGALAVLVTGISFLAVAISGWAISVEGPDARDWTPWLLVGLALAWAVVQAYLVPALLQPRPVPAVPEQERRVAA